jgi:outer membrane protein assembly factor BamE (lipoprotein component of BamABCDE complex)
VVILAAYLRRGAVANLAARRRLRNRDRAPGRPLPFAVMLRTFLLACSLALTAGCAIMRTETNDPIDAVVVNSLQPGVTTAREVVEKLGAPTEVVQLGRRTAYRYDASSTKGAGLFLIVFNMLAQDTRSDRVWVLFDEKDVLTHYGATFATHRTQYCLPWEDVHEPSDNAERDAERPGVAHK